jgi:hypothetical protein
MTIIIDTDIHKHKVLDLKTQNIYEYLIHNIYL